VLLFEAILFSCFQQTICEGASLGVVGGYCVKRQDTLFKTALVQTLVAPKMIDGVMPWLAKKRKRLTEILTSKLFVSLFILMFFIGTGTLMMHYLEEWPYLDSLYFCVLALTSVRSPFFNSLQKGNDER
jgi:hypothetical protein